MRKILITVLSIVIVLIFIVIYYTLHGREIRQTELNNAVMSSMKNAMEMLLEEENTPKNQEEWIIMFLQSLTIQIDSTSELTVKILEADMEKGILSVEAVLEFGYIFGKTGSVTCYRTVILENYLVFMETFELEENVDGKNTTSYTI